jgi:hypothetical protein
VDSFPPNPRTLSNLPRQSSTISCGIVDFDETVVLRFGLRLCRTLVPFDVNDLLHLLCHDGDIREGKRVEGQRRGCPRDGAGSPPEQATITDPRA